uniref:Uncharacterized protein n=1 Tax=Tetradesmus obliquus TaxID=3088 RepID=A0A383WE37_TETOB|eukprot:jgi/Sobl393_1/5020/SZX75868.1
MRLKVLMAPLGAGQTEQVALDVFCGQGQQILRWLAYAACAQLAYKRSEALGKYVPQTVLSKDGNVLDVDLVLSEAVSDQDEVLVEYSDGPTAFRTRWEGRPKSPPLSWNDAGSEAEPSPTAWLEELDLVAEGLAALQEPSEQQDAAAAESSLSRVREVLLQHAGALQMLFLLYTCEASTPVDAIHRMTLPQFKAMLHAAKVTSSSLPPEKLDELFTAVQASKGAVSRKGQTPSNTAGFDLADFMVALVHVAYVRFSAESFTTGPSNTPLSTKLLSMLQDCIFAHLFPELQRRVEKLSSAVTPPAQALLRKGRRLTEQVLERCQIRRVRSRVLRVDVRYVAKHLQRWGLLGKEFTLPELAPVIIFAKQASTEPYKFEQHAQPLALDYDEFERLLLGLALLQARVRKRVDAFDEVLGELLDSVYKKAGVLLGLDQQQPAL